MSLKLCTHIGNILKMCMRVLDGARIDFERINSLLNLVIFAAFCTVRYYQLLLQQFFEGFFSYFVNMVWNIKKICIWLFNIDKNNFDMYIAF